jgi:hypothetical protein
MTNPIPQFIVRASRPEILAFLIVATAAAFLTPSAHAQSVVYRETFYSTVNNGTLNTANPSLGWHFDKSPTGAIGQTVVNADGLATRSGLNGEPIDLPAINAGTYAGTDQGIIFTTAGDARQGLFYTSEYTALSSQNITQISWYAANSATSPTQQVAIQVNGNWFISSTLFTTPALSGGAFAANTAIKETLTFAGSTWKALSYTTGATPFSISGTAVALPTGDVTAFGLFVDTANSGNIRFDTYEIMASSIPEPSSYAMILGLTVLGTVACRRRKYRKALATPAL